LEKAMARSKSYYDMRDALVLSGCPVCRVRSEYTEHMLDGLLYENVNDPGLRSRMRQARGFCPEHSWGLARKGAALGVAIMMHDVLREVLRRMEGARFRAQSGLSLGRVQEALDDERPRAATAEVVADLAPQATCPVCVRVGEVEAACLDALLDNLLGEDGLLERYGASDGLCLAHFRQALARVSDETIFGALMAAQGAIWGKLAEQLAEAIRKSGYRFRDEPVGEEAIAWLRAIAAVGSERPRQGRS